MTGPGPGACLALACLAGLAGCKGRAAQLSSPAGAAPPPATQRSGPAAGPAGAAVRWEPRGPGGGGALYHPSISPHDGADLVLSTDMSSVFRSRDFGGRFAALPFRELLGGSATPVRFTDDPRVLYALSADPGGGRLRKSTDGGATWRAPVADVGGRDLRALLVPGGAAGRVVVADSREVLLSQDGGAHFRPLYRSPRAAGLVVAGAHAHGAEVVIATSDGLLVSHDGGARFAIAPAEGLGAGEAMVSFAGATTADGRTLLYAVAFRAEAAEPGVTGGELDAFAGLYASESGRPFARRGPAGGGDVRLSLVATAGNDAVAYAAGGDRPGERPVVLRSADGGATWQSVLRTAGNANVATGWIGEGGAKGWGFAEYALGLAVRPGDSSRLAVTDLGAVHVSSDGGRGWRQAYAGREGETPAGRATPAAVRSRGNGIDPTSVWWVAFAGAGRLFAAYTDIGGAFSDDGGESWTRGGDSGLRDNTAYHAVVAGGGEVYAATSTTHDLYQSGYLTDDRVDGTARRPGRGDVLVSRDHGAHFRPLLGTPVGHPVAFLAIDEPLRALYAAVVHSREGGIYRLPLDGRGAPERLPAPPRTEGHPGRVQRLGDGSLLCAYAARRLGDYRHRGAFTESAGVFLLPPGAGAWIDRTAPAMRRHTRDLVVDPTDDTESTWLAGVFSAGGDAAGGLYRTADRGQSWRRISPQLDVESATVAADGRGAWLTTEGAGLWHTDDVRAADPRWTPVEEYPFSHPLRLLLDPDDPSRLWATSFGGGLRLWAPAR